MINARIQAKIAAVIDRRRAERRRARRLAPVRLTPCMIRAAGAVEELPGWVHNLSVCGAGLLSARPFEPGVAITVLFINAAHTFALSATFKVVRCYRVVNGDYFLGGQFMQPLRYDELLPFMV
jgi:PilZ domain